MEQELLTRLVALNRERAAEEKKGLVPLALPTHPGLWLGRYL